MATIERPNKEALTKALDIFRDAMRPFLIRGLKRVRGAKVEDVIQRSLPHYLAESFQKDLQRSQDLPSALDVNLFPHLIQSNWRDAFALEFSGDRKIVSELWLIKDARNEVAHPGSQDLEDNFTKVHLFHISSILGSIKAPEQKQAVDNILSNLETSPSLTSTSQQSDARNLTAPVKNGQRRKPKQARASNLRPWREVIRPNQDVAQGSYQEAEFAADLQQVYDGRADTTQYGNPVSFFIHTYITPGIRTLMVNTLKRLTGQGGDPVIQTKTGFGGGKTHSLIALYHLVCSADTLLNFEAGSDSRVSREIRAIMEEAEFREAPSDLGKVAVLDGTFLAPSDSTVIPETGDPLNTLWGVMAYQLGGQDAYDIIGEAARRGTAPGGGQLDALFNHVGPCVILIDELVAYVRNAGAAQDNIYTFVQALTQSARRSANVALVITLPESRVEAGTDAGMEALDRLESLLGRIEANWEPLSVNEAFEVVRRRLFGEITDMAARDEICATFVRMYSRNRADYPQGVAEQNYLIRLQDCYPIHPEIFERLYSDWSSIPGFQRTRGVLRMMASCVHRLYLNNDSSPLIMPADLPLSDSTLANEFIRLLPGQWRPVLSEADSDNSRADNIDKESQRFADVGGAARRIARTVFLGSAPGGATRGIDLGRIHLGAVLPGQGVSSYNEALNRLVGNLYYLYSADNRFFFHAEENLNKVSNDRANALSDRAVDDEIIARLEEVRNRRGDVILYGGDTSQISDTDTVRLIVLPPNMTLASRSAETDAATPQALEILQFRGHAPRIRRNTLLFLAAKRDEVRNLRNEVREYLAWHSIINGATKITKLTGNRLRQARTAVDNADRNVMVALVNSYRWAMSPVQSDPQKAEYRLSQAPISTQDTGEIIRAAFDRFLEDEALVDSISPASLNSMLNQYIWKKEDDAEHLSVDRLWDLMTGNVYMHRLRNRSVLETCIRKGVEQGEWGCADSVDGDRYDGLRYVEPSVDFGLTMLERPPALLVHREAATRQKEAEKAISPQPDDSSGDGIEPQPVDPLVGPGPDKPAPLAGKSGPHRIVVRRTTGPNFSLDEIDQLRDEIIRNLRDDGGEISVQIIVSASKAEGFSENIARSVRQNSQQLKLEFSEEREY